MVTHALRQSLKVWWNNLVQLTLLHFAWVVCQMLIVTAPPATAALYALVEKVAQGDLLSGREVWTTFRAAFVPAWKWAICNLVVLSLLASYLWWAGRQTALLASAVSVLALAALALWLAMNLFYWPLWLAQSDSSVRNTYRNAFVIVAANPAASAALLLISLGVVAVSTLTILPLIHVLMIWLALFGLNMTRALIRRLPIARSANS